MEIVNTWKMKAKAHAMGRRNSGGSARFNPFRHISYGSPKRASTMDAAERGKSGSEGDTAQLNPTSSAPGRLLTPIQQSARNSKELDGNQEQGEVYDSQAPTLPNEPDGASIRQRTTQDITSKPQTPNTIKEAAEEDKSKERRNTGFFKHVEPTSPFTVWNQIQRVFFGSPINILILAAPAGIALHFIGYDGKVVFAVNFIAIVPLAAMLSNATEEIAMRTGEVLGGLINASFGNAVELIVAIIALSQDQIKVVQTSLVGSILSNLLLVLGMCFFCGGINRKEQFFNTTVAQTAASLLALSVGSLIVPTVFAHTDDLNSGSIALPANAVPSLSHGVALILLIVYASYLFFQMKTHVTMFNEQSQKVEGKPIFKKSLPEGAIASGVARVGAGAALDIRSENGESNKMMVDPHAMVEEEEEGPQLSFVVAFATLIGATVIIALCAEGMVSGIEAITATGAVSEEFVGLILLPIVGNACEHATAVTVAIKDKMDLAIGVAIGSSMQVALLLIPLLVIIGWGMDKPDMTLAFDTFQVIVLFVSVLLVNYLIGDGKSHWLEGLILTCLYAIIATCAWFYPTIPEDSSG
ncbi:Calcium/proton exchanger [Annulohypoxylon truncatum]|uniref:Calcium/proton exchanger n=1 Tax=Annulohypoxylon truncatum TaxID=327061 RepID=UPI00200753EA|nr:Calcium/proton exchanger [Annulohypoxylon truncatum]KAI1209526.1 Calcium/proton exchanger [Annulohypoxylon truncatum]